MVRKVFNTKNRSEASRVLQQSSKAICGVFEREVVVPAEKVSSTKSLLRSKGFIIVGTSEPIGRNRKIWFVPAGAAF